MRRIGRLSWARGAGLAAAVIVAAAPCVRGMAADPAKPPVEKSAAELLPNTTVLYAEISDPKRLLGTVLDHPLRKRVEAIGDVKKGLASPEYQKFQAVVSLVERQIGMKWRPALETASGGGIYFGLDAVSQSGAVLVKSTDAKALEKVRDTFSEMVRGDAKNKGQKDPIETKMYRGLTGHKSDKGFVGIAGPWLVVANKPQLAERVLDNYLDSDGATRSATLAANREFDAARNLALSAGKNPASGNSAARSDVAAAPSLWAYLRVGALREVGVGKEFFKPKADNAGGEVLLGGLVNVLGKTPFVTASLFVENEGVRLTLAAPYDGSWIAAPRQYYFGPPGKGSAPPLLRPKQTVATLSVYRDVAGFWSASDSLLAQKAQEELALADSHISSLLSGREFGKDVIGGLGPEWQIVAARQDFSKVETPEPHIKLPGFAASVQLRDAEKMQRNLRIAFQTVVGYVNLGNSGSGQPALEIASEKHGKSTVVAATYPSKADAKEADKKEMYYNFSPSMALVGDRLIVSSTKELAKELVDLHAGGVEKSTSAAHPNSAGAVDNLVADVDLRVARELFRDNRAMLVAQNIVEKENSKADAEKEIDGLAELIGWFQSASVRLATGDKTLRLDLDVKLAPAP